MKNLNYFKNKLVDQGKLQVFISNQDKAMPISDVKIDVIRRYDYTVIEELVTDSLGRTETVELGAPPLEYSLKEQGEKPYSEYNLSIRADGFEPVNIQRIQIMPESKAMQLIQLKPIEYINYGPRTIHISEHTLWGNYPSKIPEVEVKTLPDSGGSIVLPEPVIPKYVIVHLGEPTNKYVRDVSVPFKDYVKNVASSEIYPTWPTETIKANVLAIISLVLNRVYTEWYRRNGYAFNITNSTAVDQAFVYGRNIFEEISNIVDEIFTTYITRPEIKQPLFTQHYDGVKAKCEIGLSQWKSRKMGEMGYNFFEILKNFYGDDIYLSTATDISVTQLLESDFRNFHNIYEPYRY